MSDPLLTEHSHLPVFRVIRAGWRDPLDSSFSRRKPDNRWNTSDFSALYCCCSEQVAWAVVRDVFRFAAVSWNDLQPEVRPGLVEISWTGTVVDVVSREGLHATDLSPDYPKGVTKSQTRALAVRWHNSGHEGVVSRSASLMRLGFSKWVGSHEPWGELVIFVANAKNPPTLTRHRDDLDVIFGSVAQ